jgi:hypothetical protein
MKTIGPMFALFVLVSLSVACSDDKPTADESSGGENDNAFDTAEKNVNEAQRDFQEEFKEEREFVDEKTNKAVGEGRKAAGKVGDAVSGDDADDEEPAPGQP